MQWRDDDKGMSTNTQLVEILREREFELFTVRRNLQEVSEKFLQLENAFAVNLRVQSQLEDDLEKLEKNSNKRKTNSNSETGDQNWKAQTELYSSLTRIRVERDRWKQAFLHQKSTTEKRKLEHEKSIDTIRDECEKILKNCRETGEKHFRELLKICEDSREKARVLEKDSKALQARERSTAGRILEVANLLETLEKLHGVKIEVLCRRAAKALRSLANNNEAAHIDGMRELREVTRDMRENDENADSLEFLQAQNSVLRQVVKSLKRKFQSKIPERPEDVPTEIKENNNSNGNSDGNVVGGKNDEEENCKKCEKELKNNETDNSIYFLAEKEGKLKIENAKESTRPEEEEEKNGIDENCENNHSQCNDRTENRLCVDAFESHKNGIPYSEYIYNFFGGRKLRIRHSNDHRMKNSTLLVEFVNTEKAFYEAPLDRMVFYLGNDVREIVNLKKIGVHCGVQTKRLKFSEKFVQTTITGTNGFSRLNAGVGMLNSEKRAIERSLGNLEIIVASLKENALGQAVSMIGKNTMNLNKEFFDCVDRLER